MLCAAAQSKAFRMYGQAPVMYGPVFWFVGTDHQEIGILQSVSSGG